MRRFINIVENAQDLNEARETILAVAPEATEIWFHGSRARGDHRPDSDWDFIVVFPNDISVQSYVRYASANGPFAQFRNRGWDVQPARLRDKENNTAPLYWAVKEGRMIWRRSAA